MGRSPTNLCFASVFAVFAISGLSGCSNQDSVDTKFVTGSKAAGDSKAKSKADSKGKSTGKNPSASGKGSDPAAGGGEDGLISEEAEDAADTEPGDDLFAQTEEERAAEEAALEAAKRAEEEAQAAADATMAQLTDDCGGESLMAAAADATILQKNSSSAPVTQTETGVTATLQTDLSIVASKAKATQTMNVRIVSLDGPFFILPIARPIAEQKAKDNSGSTTITNVNANEIPALGDKHPVWGNVICSIVPGVRVDSTRGSTSASVSFDPPAPLALSPKAAMARFVAEVGDQRVFDGLKATVLSSNRAELSGKSTVSGRITITKVSPTATVNGQTVAGDFAYKVTTEFESPAVTYALGLVPEVTYYFRGSSRDFGAMVADTKVSGNPVMSFSY